LIHADQQDEIIRQPVPDPLETTPTKSKTSRNKAKAEPTTPQPKQISLTKFLKPLPSSLPPKPKPKVKTHDLFVSDSKTRASGTMPRPENTQSGQMQLMLYKELLDGLLQAGKDGPARNDDSKLDILPSSTPFSFARLFTHLGLDSTLPFSSTFQKESRAVVRGNGLRDGAATAKCLDDMVACWTAYVERLSLGPDPQSEPFLELVYRRTGRSKLPGTSKKRRKVNKDDQDRQLQLTIQESLRAEAPLSSSQVSKTSTDGQYWTGTQPRTQSEEREESELAAAVEMSMVQPNVAQAPIQEQDAILSEVVASDLSASTAVGLQTPLPSSQAVHVAHQDTIADEKETIRNPERDANHTPQTDSSPPVTPAPRRSTRLAKDPATPVNVDSSPPVESTAATPAEVQDAKSDPPEEVNPGAGSIIGKHRFRHSETKLAAHLNSILAFWSGERAPVGVKVEDTSRCGWCEFEEGCEWR
jgi:exonuclease V